MGHILLIAIINASTPVPGSFVATGAGYQSSTMQKFDSLDQCKTAMKHLWDTYEKALTKTIHVDNRSLRCVDLDTNKVIAEM